MRAMTVGVVGIVLLGLAGATDASAFRGRPGAVVASPRIGARGGVVHPHVAGQAQFRGHGHGHFHGHGFVRTFPRPFVFVNPYPFFAPSTVYVAPPVTYAPPSYYYSSQTLVGGSTYVDVSVGTPGAAAGMPTTSVAPSMPSVIVYPQGRYELRGDGITQPYVWVWIPNPPAGPPPSADSLGS